MIELSDQDLLRRLRNFEDFFVERKTSSDKRDWLPTAVAFANSAPIDYPAVLFVGVRNNGTIEEGANLDSLQRTFSQLIGEAYPPVATFSKVLEEAGKQFLAIIVPGSPNRPHFAGHSFVRVGSETRKASELQFAELIAQRNNKVRELLKWKNKTVYVRFYDRIPFAGFGFERGGGDVFNLEDCNQFYVTLSREGGGKDRLSLHVLEFSMDYSVEGGRLRLEVSSR
jgi:Putative DNA-binding domain